MGKIKIELGFCKGEKKLTSYMKTDQNTTAEDLLRCVEWQAALVGVSGGVQLARLELRPHVHRVFYMRGATAYATVLPDMEAE